MALFVVVSLVLGPSPKGISHKRVPDLAGSQDIPERFPIVLRVDPRVRLRANINDRVYRVGLQKFDQARCGKGRVPDGKKALAFLRGIGGQIVHRAHRVIVVDLLDFRKRGWGVSVLPAVQHMEIGVFERALRVC